MPDNALTYYCWSDNQKRYGKWLIVSRDDNRDSDFRRIFHLGIESLGDDEDCGMTGNRIRLSAFGWTLIFATPSILKPHKQWIDTSHYEWSKGPGSGYWDTHKTEYSISVFPGSAHMSYGAQTHDSDTDKTKVWFYPWRESRLVRHSLYGPNGEKHVDLPIDYKIASDEYDRYYQLIDSAPTRKFIFKDYDGEEILATTKIEEREWRYGVQSFKWIGWFKKNHIRRSLDLAFSSEVGRRKGSWKGGTIGHSINMLPGELHEQAFKRYCEENNLTYIGEYFANPT